eukprot:comp5199_c0_seq1/m.4352 comp5199_c0_seq1/g.4352  ORF comp5199_c0_seq1/g.4352 comp5199_c0_seq1/m.4352 type:complete len:121 (-) comp5199_c0_seq1:141-503(-)
MSKEADIGLKALEEAENRAKKIIADARAARAATMRQCQETVDKAIKDYKTQQESEFNAYATEQLGSNDGRKHDIEKDTTKQIEEIKFATGKKREEIVNDLFVAVKNVSVKVPTRQTMKWE